MTMASSIILKDFLSSLESAGGMDDMVWASSGLSENRNLLSPVYHEIISGYSVIMHR